MDNQNLSEIDARQKSRSTSLVLSIIALAAAAIFGAAYIIFQFLIPAVALVLSLVIAPVDIFLLLMLVWGIRLLFVLVIGAVIAIVALLSALMSVAALSLGVVSFVLSMVDDRKNLVGIIFSVAAVLIGGMTVLLSLITLVAFAIAALLLAVLLIYLFI